VLDDEVVRDDDDGDEPLEHQDELNLGDEVRLARLVDELADLEHRLVNGRVLELRVHDDAERQPEGTHSEAEHEKRSPRNAHEGGGRKLSSGDDETVFARGTREGCSAHAGLHRVRERRREKGEDEGGESGETRAHEGHAHL
jgi:hypothetical protein